MLIALALAIISRTIKNEESRVKYKKILLDLRDAINAQFPGE